MTAGRWTWVALDGGRTHYAEAHLADDGARWAVRRFRCGVKITRQRLAWAVDKEAPICGRCWRSMPDRLADLYDPEESRP